MVGVRVEKAPPLCYKNGDWMLTGRWLDTVLTGAIFFFFLGLRDAFWWQPCVYSNRELSDATDRQDREKGGRGRLRKIQKERKSKREGSEERKGKTKKSKRGDEKERSSNGPCCAVQMTLTSNTMIFVSPIQRVRVSLIPVHAQGATK